MNKLSDIYDDWIDKQKLLRSLAASIISTVILYCLQFLCLSHQSFRNLKNQKSLEEIKKKYDFTLKCIKIKIYIYYFFSFLFILIFGYYISCFCAVFENTQILLLESMASSSILILLYPFGIYFLSAIFRIGSLKCGKRHKMLLFN